MKHSKNRLKRSFSETGLEDDADEAQTLSSSSGETDDQLLSPDHVANYIAEDGTTRNDSDQHARTEVCYGMLTNVSVAPLRKGKSQFVFDTRAGHTSSWPVRFRSNTAILIAPENSEVGQIDDRNSPYLLSLSKVAPTLRCEVFLLSSDHDTLVKSTRRDIFPAVVNLYGDMKSTDVVDADLDRLGLFLQEPMFLDKSIPYLNPQVFTVDGAGMTVTFGSTHELLQQKFVREVAEVFIESNDFDDIPSSFIQPPDILSPLKDHQVTAVKFALSRESNPSQAGSPSFWKQQHAEAVVQYKHTLTKEHSLFHPNDCRGGLIADDMGMGKSLSMLALILHTRDEAFRFARSRQNLSDSTEGKATGATLIITPKSTIESWKTEIETHLTPNSVRTVIFQGADRLSQQAQLCEVDVVLTTYETAMRDRISSKGCLHLLSWFRLILDEAHKIRNINTKVYSAISSLEAERRWCLTGTPIQNDLNDIFALTKFLRFHPFIASKDIQSFIVGPLSRQEKQGLENLRAMMKVFSIRRTKQNLKLPSINYGETLVTLDKRERTAYKSIKADLRKNLADAVKKGEHRLSAKTLQGILRLRQLCSHGSSPLYLNSGGQQSNISEEVLCTQCDALIDGDTVLEVSASNCEHFLCSTCEASLTINNTDNLTEPGSCIFCSQLEQAITHDRVIEDTEQSLTSNKSGSKLSATRTPTNPKTPSSKVQAVLKALISLHKHHASTGKSIVFTQYLTALNLLAPALDTNQIPHVRIDGSTSLANRGSAIQAFQTDPTYQVALLTLGTGSVGLTLTAATHVHIIEPHWNPMVEEQACARAHRIGQTREVNVYRYIVKDSIEEIIRKRQARKIRLAGLAGVGGDYDDGEGGGGGGSSKWDRGERAIREGGQTEEDELEGILEKWRLF